MSAVFELVGNFWCCLGSNLVAARRPPRFIFATTVKHSKGVAGAGTTSILIGEALNQRSTWNFSYLRPICSCGKSFRPSYRKIPTSVPRSAHLSSSPTSSPSSIRLTDPDRLASLDFLSCVGRCLDKLCLLGLWWLSWLSGCFRYQFESHLLLWAFFLPILI